MKLRLWLPFAVALAVCGVGAAAQTPDPQWLQGAVQVCMNCHGETAFEQPVADSYLVPKLGGQNAAYIESALKAYRNRSRDHFFMRGIAAGFDGEQVKVVASYFASPAPTVKPKTAKQVDAPEELKRCLACHGSAAAGAAGTTAPVLLGQHQPYLEKAITDYLHRRRSHDIMSPQVVSADGTPLLTEEAITRIAMWFSRQPGLFVR